jgi:hypothetical protein
MMLEENLGSSLEATQGSGETPQTIMKDHGSRDTRGQLHAQGEVRYLGAHDASQPHTPPRQRRPHEQARLGADGLFGLASRRRLERDRHDGVPSQLVALVLGLAVATEHRDAPLGLVHELAALACAGLAP